MNDRGMETWELAIRESARQTLADYTAGTDRNRIDDVAAASRQTVPSRSQAGNRWSDRRPSWQG